MGKPKVVFIARQIIVLCFLGALLSGCRSTKYLEHDQYLLWENKVILTSDKVMPNKGEIKGNLEAIIPQKPNSTYISLLPINIPMKLWRYNRKYAKWREVSDSALPKSVERPVVYDSNAVVRAKMNMQSYLFNQGYFYADVEDTVVYKKKRATVIYKVKAGSNYIINRINYDIDDTAIAAVVRRHKIASAIMKGKEFRYVMLEEERSRLAELITNHGYRRFTLDNITFRIDTLDKSMFKIASSPFENAVNYITQAKSRKKNTLDIDVVIRKTDDSNAYNKFTVKSVTVLPDFKRVSDLIDTSMITDTIKGVVFKYHNRYVHPNVLYKHMFINPGNLYSKFNEDRTTLRLTELGIFQYAKVQYQENRRTRDTVDCVILLNRAKKYDFATNYEISTGTTYALGNSVGINYRNKNFMKGANQLTLGVSGGVESYYNDDIANEIIRRFKLLTWYYGVNASVNFPKFLSPFSSYLFTNSNLPHTIISSGANVVDRVNYFRLVNTSATFAYSWNETPEKTWGFTPAFMNIIRVYSTDSFSKLLAANEYLRNSYRENFIEGENVSFKLDNSAKKAGRNYTYLRMSMEEAGIMPTLFTNMLKGAFPEVENRLFAQYTKFDFDLRQYLNIKQSLIAFRFYGGVGSPYGNSQTLPYIKQYFAGGPFSLRGWRIRTLGPGSYYDSAARNITQQIDRTGDIKLEMNGEYRFPVAPLFSGAVKMTGALFGDAGNIWLSRPDKAYPGGEFALDKLGQDIAMDLGIGSRFEFASFLTLRVDVAMPVKKPYILSNKGWVFSEIDFSNPTWRSDNLVLNVSIGYPF